MSRAKELFDLHERILESMYETEESKNIYKKYIELSEKDEEELVSIILDEYEIYEDMEIMGTPITMICYIATFSRGKALGRVYKKLIDNNKFYPAQMYIKAGENEAKAIIDKIDDTMIYRFSDELKCLSFIPCNTSREFFIKNDYAKASKDIHLNGGWTIDKHNQMKKLYNHKVILFERGQNNRKSTLAPVKRTDEVCPFCGNKLTLMFKTDYEMVTCDYCACYQDIITKIDENGKAHWHKNNVKSKLLEEVLEIKGNDVEEYDFYLEESSEFRRPEYSCSEYVDRARTQIGGLPTLINEVPYAVCPECMETMEFVAQLNMEDIINFGEGVYYFFHCNQCNIVTSNFGTT